MSDAKRDAKAIFLEAIEQESPESLAEFLDRACGEDDDLRGQVEDLLKAIDKTQDFLRDQAGVDETESLADDTESTSKRIGPYKLLEKLGEGGMGAVYMAEQRHPVKRRVALKIIKPGMDSRQVIARFEAERQALAMMDHPNIAKVLDAGTTQFGRPYFVMELVRGMSITEFCDERKLTLTDRLKLFVPICHAVQHAHQKGIIHRDLKPSNILVSVNDEDAIPKVIDFGVAKAIHHTLTEKTLFTQAGQIVGTLEYMSPEQASGQQNDIDTRSDTYSLGVVLYELLVGQPPIDRKKLRSAAHDEMMRMIREDEPQKPSLKANSSDRLPSVAASRRVEPRRLTSTLRGELDWIVMKALEKDRSRRYETTKQLADDLENYLADRPVAASPPSAWYQLKKTIRRHRRAVAGLAALFLVLVTVSLILWWKNTELAVALRNVERAEGESNSINDFFINDLLGQADPDLNPYQEKTTVVSLLDRASEEIDTSTAFQEFPEVEATIRLVIGKTYNALGQWRKAEDHLTRSLAIRREQLGRPAAKTLEALESLVDVQTELEHYEPALEAANELEAHWRQVGSDAEPAVVRAKTKRSMILMHLGRYTEAESLAMEAMAEGERAADTDDDINVRARQAVAEILSTQFKDFEVARSLYEQNLTSLRRRGEAEHSNSVLTVKLHLAEHLIAQGRTDEAEELCAEVLQTRSAVTLPDDHPYTILARLSLGSAQLNLGKLDESAQNVRMAYQQALNSLGEHHATTWMARRLIVLSIANSPQIVPDRMEFTEEAEGLAQQNVRTVAEQQWPQEHSNAHQTQVDLAMMLAMKGIMKMAGGNPLALLIKPEELKQSEQVLTELYESSKQLRGPTDSMSIQSGLHLLQVRLMNGDRSEEMEELLRELRDSSGSIPDGLPAKANLTQALGMLLFMTNRAEQSLPYLREYFMYCRESRNVSQTDKNASVEILVQCLRSQGLESQLRSVTLPGEGVYRIRLSQPSAFPIVSVRSRLALDNFASVDTCQPDSSHVFVAPTATRTFDVFGKSLTTNPQLGDPNIEIHVCALTNDQQFQRELNADGERDWIVFEYPREVFTIPMKAGCLYRIEADSAEFRPIVRIENSQGRCLKWIVDRAQPQATLDFAPLEDGEYRIIVLPTKRDGSGELTLSCEEYTPTDELAED